MITPTFEDECEEEEEDKEEEEEEKEDEFLTSDDSESSLQCEDEELEQRDQRWEIVAKLPPVVACEEKRSSSSLLEAWMSAVPRKGKRKLKAVDSAAIRVTVFSRISRSAIFAWRCFGASTRDVRRERKREKEATDLSRNDDGWKLMRRTTTTEMKKTFISSKRYDTILFGQNKYFSMIKLLLYKTKNYISNC